MHLNFIHLICSWVAGHMNSNIYIFYYYFFTCIISITYIYSNSSFLKSNSNQKGFYRNVPFTCKYMSRGAQIMHLSTRDTNQTFGFETFCSEIVTVNGNSHV